MGFKRYTASADTTVTNAFKANLSNRGTGSNMGYADSVEVFSIYGQTSGSTLGQSQELSRTLIQFPITTVATDRTAGAIPASGSVNFFLKLSNAKHPWTLPQDFTLVVAAVSRSWAEGTGLDMDDYVDLGKSNWMSASTTTAWTNIGGDFRDDNEDSDAPIYRQTFALGYEDLEINITPTVERWMQTSGTALHIDNYGLGIFLTSSQEAYAAAAAANGVIENTGGAETSYYTKKFFARSSEYFYKRPWIEARWDSRVQDDRGSFYYSSSMAPATDNLNTLYLYNYVRGQLTNIPDIAEGLVYVSLFSGTADNKKPSGIQLLSGAGAGDATCVTGGWVSTGIYSASICMTSSSADGAPSKLFDLWASLPTGSTQYKTGSLATKTFRNFEGAPTFERDTAIKNMQPSYRRNQTIRFRTFVRDKNWSPTIYTVATNVNPTEIIESASYRVLRLTDNYEVISYGTGSEYSTYLSFDVSGNYFDLNMLELEAGYMYGIKFSYYNGSIATWVEQPETFKFRVDE
jgi:hypothetical protein